MSKPVDLFVKDLGKGRPLVFVHSLAVDHNIWQYQHHHFLALGYRVVAFDRRGHGRSAPSDDFSADTLADDISRVLAERDLKDVTLIGHSMGCGEIARYMARHRGARVARVVLVGATTPCLLKSDSNPDGIDGRAFEALRALWAKDFPAWVAANARPFFVPETSQATIDWGIAQMRATPPQVAIACNRSMVESDFRADLKGFKVPTLVIHGTKDASAPLALTGQPTAALIPHARFNVYEDAPHGLMLTHMDRLHADIEGFIAGT